MSKYTEKIEKDYNDGNITLAEITKLREDFDKLSAYDKRTLDIKYGKKEADSSPPSPKISNEEKVINLLIEQNSDISTIKAILQFYLLMFIISIIASIVMFL